MNKQNPRALPENSQPLKNGRARKYLILFA